MEYLELLSWLSYPLMAYVAFKFIWFIFADGDLTLMWKTKFGLQADSLAGKVVWITGSSSGLGEDLAYWMAKGGAKLVLTARRVKELERVKEKCIDVGKLPESDVLVLPLDICQYESHQSAVESVVQHFGKIDILVSNAGRSQRAMIKDTQWEVDRQMVELNLMAQVALTKKVLPIFRKQKSGHVAVTSSLAGKMGLTNSATYCLTKFALNGWFESLALEGVEDNIGVTVCCPGPVLTPFLEVAFTGEPGKVHGVAASVGENRMTSERCAELMGIAIANKLDETWLAKQPWLTFCYMAQYMPSVGRSIAKRMGKKMMNKLRDAKKN